MAVKVKGFYLNAFSARIGKKPSAYSSPPAPCPHPYVSPIPIQHCAQEQRLFQLSPFSLTHTTAEVPAAIKHSQRGGSRNIAKQCSLYLMDTQSTAQEQAYTSAPIARSLLCGALGRWDPGSLVGAQKGENHGCSVQNFTQSK